MGTGSIYRRKDGKWIAQESIGPRTMRRFVRRSAATRAEAAVLLEEIRGERRAGVTPNRLTTGAYLAQWVQGARNIRPTTRHGYRVAVEIHLSPLIGHVRLRDLTPLHVEAVLAQLAPAMSPKALRNVHAVLRRALGQAVRVGLLARNVASREFVDAPRVPSAEPRALSHAEVRQLIRTARGDRIEPLLVVALGTGMRLGELLGLAWEDVDLEGRLLTVRRELARREGRYVRVEPKTERSRRIVPLADPVVAALAKQRRTLVDAGFVPTATGPVFTNRQGGPLNGSWVTHHFYDLLAAAGIPRLPFKNLRTTFGSRLFESGVSDRRIADILGHARTRTTQAHYIATAGTSQDPALRAVEELVG